MGVERRHVEARAKNCKTTIDRATAHGEFFGQGPGECREYRESWGCFRDRRPDLYAPLTTLDGRA